MPIKSLEASTSTTDKRRAIFRAHLAAEEIAVIANHRERNTYKMLDIGGAFGIHARFFREKSPQMKVDILDVKPSIEKLVYEGSYFDFIPEKQYDFLWCSHVVEHLRNPGMFFDKAFADVKEGGWVGITVPPLKSDVTFQHVTLWNAGLLLVHLVHAGFDCSDAHVATYGYNVSVVVQKKDRGTNPKNRSLPEVNRKGVYFDGNIDRLNWIVDAPVKLEFRRKDCYVEDIISELVAKKSRSGFFDALDHRKRNRLFYFDQAEQAAYLAG